MSPCPHFSPLLSREMPLVAAQSALLFIDAQNFSAHRRSSLFADLDDAQFEQRYGWFFHRLQEETLANMLALQAACRQARVEVMYTVIESLTADGRDRSLDYKLTGFHIAKDSWEGKVLDELAPGEDEIVLPKTSSSVFISTNIDYLLRNLGIRQLVICGFLTDQCVESAIRDAADLGYLVTQASDACLTHSAARQEASLRAVAGYCRQRTVRELVEELKELKAAGKAES